MFSVGLSTATPRGWLNRPGGVLRRRRLPRLLGGLERGTSSIVVTGMAPVNRPFTAKIVTPAFW